MCKICKLQTPYKIPADDLSDEAKTTTMENEIYSLREANPFK